MIYVLHQPQLIDASLLKLQMAGDWIKTDQLKATPSLDFAGTANTEGKCIPLPYQGQLLQCSYSLKAKLFVNCDSC